MSDKTYSYPLMKKLLPAIWLTCFISITLIFIFSVKNFSQSLVLGNENGRVGVSTATVPLFPPGDLDGNTAKSTPFLKDVNPFLTKVMKGVILFVYPNEWNGLRVAKEMAELEGQDKLIDIHIVT